MSVEPLISACRSKRSATIAALILATACSSIPPAAAGRTAPGVSLEVLSVGRDDSGRVAANLRLVNGSQLPFTYFGYSLEHPFPLTMTEVRHRLRWRAPLHVGCGTGLEPVTLAPGKSVEMTVPLWMEFAELRFLEARVALWDADYVRVVRSSPIRVPSL